MNNYASLSTIKNAGTLGITGTDFDGQLLRIGAEASRMIDKFCERYFYIWEGTRYYDGAATRLVLDDDVQSVTTLKVDIDGDGVYESTFDLTATIPDAYLYPLNITPKTRLEANPYGDYGHFGAGQRKAVQIVGVFGHGADYPASYTHDAQSTVNSAFSSTATSLTVTSSTASELSAGHTLRINSEQVFLNAVPTGSSSQIFAVTRAVNGTSAAAATTGTAISIYDYPEAIIQACVIQTVRTWKRRESGYVNTIINTDMGNVQVYKGLDPDVQQIIRQYRRERIPRYW